MKNIINKFFKNNKGGSEITQSLLLIGVALSLVLTIFFPGLKTVFKKVAASMDDWLISSAQQIFDVPVPDDEVENI